MSSKIERTLIIKSVSAQISGHAVELAQGQDLSWAELTEALCLAAASAAHWSNVDARVTKQKEEEKG